MLEFFPFVRLLFKFFDCLNFVRAELSVRGVRPSVFYIHRFCRRRNSQAGECQEREWTNGLGASVSRARKRCRWGQSSWAFLLLSQFVGFRVLLMFELACAGENWAPPWQESWTYGSEDRASRPNRYVSVDSLEVWLCFFCGWALMHLLFLNVMQSFTLTGAVSTILRRLVSGHWWLSFVLTSMVSSS